MYIINRNSNEKLLNLLSFYFLTGLYLKYYLFMVEANKGIKTLD
jgi:hypothetical protein